MSTAAQEKLRYDTQLLYHGLNWFKGNHPEFADTMDVLSKRVTDVVYDWQRYSEAQCQEKMTNEPPPNNPPKPKNHFMV